MTKSIVQKKLDTRKKELVKLYYNSCDLLKADGSVGTYAGSRTRRARYKRDVCIITLVQELLSYNKQDNITLSEDAEFGLFKLLGE